MHDRAVVAIVTGGSSGTGREIARALARRGWAIVVVYLEDQPTAEATVEELLAGAGKVVAVRADMADAFDVRRLFAEAAAAFGDVDVVVHTTTESTALLQAALQQLGRPDALVSAGRASPEQVLSLLERWRR